MDSREKLERQRLKAEKQRQEDIALTKVLYWIVGAVVLEFLLLMTQKYFHQLHGGRVRDQHWRWPSPRPSKVRHLRGDHRRRCGPGAGPGPPEKGKAGRLLSGPWACSWCCWAIYSALVWQLNATGVEFLIFANVVFAVLAFVYYIYQTEFFAVAVTCAAGMLGIYIRFAGSGGVRTYVALGLMVAVLVVVAAVAAAAQRERG